MDFEQMQKIVDDAPEWATGINTKSGSYFGGDKFCRGDVLLTDLRTELAKREPMDLRDVDIPHGTIVLEK